MTQAQITPLLAEERDLERRRRAARAVVSSSAAHAQDRAVAGAALDLAARWGHVHAGARDDAGVRRVVAVVDINGDAVELDEVLVGAGLRIAA